MATAYDASAHSQALGQRNRLRAMISEVNAAHFEQQVIASKLPVLVEFFSEYCQPCQQMLLVLAEIAKERPEKVRIFKFNAGEAPEFSSRFHVRSVPNFVLFRDGQPVGQRTGSASKRDLLGWLDATA
jgi:thioredoxin 1